MSALRFRVTVYPADEALFHELTAREPGDRGTRMLVLATLGLSGARISTAGNSPATHPITLRVTVTRGHFELFEALTGLPPRRRPASLITWAAAALGGAMPVTPQPTADEAPPRDASVWSPGPISF